ncbi:hypothetical protein Tco_0190574 [Tanacetum coccineum]
MKILSVVNLKTYSRYGYTYLKEIVLRRADYNEYKISESDFKNLHPNDFEDMYLLHLQGKLNHLSGFDKVNLFNAVSLWIRTLSSENGMEYLATRQFRSIRQSSTYRTKLDATDSVSSNKITPYHMVTTTAFSTISGIEKRIWSEDDRRRSKEFMEVIKRRLKIRRIFMSLKSFVSGRLRDVD